MPFNWGAFGGGLTQGFAQGYQGAQDRALKRRMLDIQMQKAQREADLSNFYDQVAKQMTAATATMNPGYSVESPENSPTFAQVPFQQPPLPDIGQAAKVTQPDTRTLMKAAAVRGGHFTSPVFSQEPADLATQLKALEGSGISLGNQGTHQLSVGLGPTGTRLNVRPTPQHSAANEAYWATKRAGGSEQEALQAALDFQARQAETRSFNTIQGQVNAQTAAPQGTPLVPGAAPRPAVSPKQAVLPPSASGTAPGMIGTKSIQDMTLGDLMGGGQGQAATPPTMAAAPTGTNRYLEAQRGRAAATKGGTLQAEQTNPLPPGKESRVVRINPKGEVEFAPMGITPAQWGGREVPQETVHALTAMAPAEEALKEFNTAAEALAKQNAGLSGRLSSIAGTTSREPGALQGFLSGVAQEHGASNAGDNMQAVKGFLMQHYESMFAGVRGASGAQIQAVLESRAPQPGMNPQMILQRKQYMNDVFYALKNGLLRVAGGEPVEQVKATVDAVIHQNPDNLKAIPEPPKNWKRAYR